MNDSIREYRASNPTKAQKAPKPTRPVLSKSYLPLPSKKSKTRVAALSGSHCDLAVLHTPTATGWVKGIYQKIFPRENAPYLIRWASKPPQQIKVTEAQMKIFHRNYEFCADNEIFGGIVGNEILWPILKTGCYPRLRYVKVIRCLPDPPKPRLFVLSFRDGATMQVTGETIDRAQTRHNDILKDREAINDFSTPDAHYVTFLSAHINAAENEKGTYLTAKPDGTASQRYGDDFSATISEMTSDSVDTSTSPETGATATTTETSLNSVDTSTSPDAGATTTTTETSSNSVDTSTPPEAGAAAKDQCPATVTDTPASSENLSDSVDTSTSPDACASAKEQCRDIIADTPATTLDQLAACALSWPGNSHQANEKHVGSPMKMTAGSDKALSTLPTCDETDQTLDSSSQQTNKKAEVNNQTTTLNAKWFELTGLDVVGPLISLNDERYELHQRLQQFVPGPLSQEYENLVNDLQTLLDGSPLDSSDDSTVANNDNAQDQEGAELDATVSRVHQTDVGQQQVVDIALEVSEQRVKNRQVSGNPSGNTKNNDTASK
jgi:hypothetical protein